MIVGAEYQFHISGREERKRRDLETSLERLAEKQKFGDPIATTFLEHIQSLTRFARTQAQRELIQNKMQILLAEAS